MRNFRGLELEVIRSLFVVCWRWTDNTYLRRRTDLNRIDKDKKEVEDIQAHQHAYFLCIEK